MRVPNLHFTAIALGAGVLLSGCAYGGLGYGPYSGVNVGVGYGNAGYGYCDPYYDAYCSDYGYNRYGYNGYGSLPYYGWYDGFYYPGSGYYVYDRYRKSYRMSDAQRRYWEWRRKGSPTNTSGTDRLLQNWADFQNGGQTTTSVRSLDRGVTRVQRSGINSSSHSVSARQLRAERRQQRAEVRESRPGRGVRRISRSEARSEKDD